MRFAVLDVETTGNRGDDEVIQFGLALIDDGAISGTYSSYVYTEKEIPEFIVQMTGITQEMVSQAPRLEQVVAELLPLLTDRVLVGHNVNFDLDFLQRSLIQTGSAAYAGRVLDTMDLLRICYPQLGSMRLGMACNELGVSLNRPHHAEYDALATAELFLLCLKKLDSLPLLTVQRITALLESRHDAGDLKWLFEQIRFQREMTQAIETDRRNYFRQIHLKVGDWVDSQDEEEEAAQDAVELAFEAFYEQAKESLKATFDHYEERAEQEKMIFEVYDAFQEGKHLLIEAGTGTGKSLAYLLPALYTSLTEGRRVVVSTHTINLQEQLRRRDLPLLQQISPYPFKAAVLKGRNHYLCLRKYEQRLAGRDYDSRDQLIAAAQMLVWLGETDHGDDEELQLTSRGKEFWRSVESDTHSCLNRACPWFKKCFYHRSRHAAGEADIVITNHSMLLTDVRAENRIIPPYDLLVIDEAHHFEQTASKHMGVEIGYYSFLNPLNWLVKDAKTGQLPSLIHSLKSHPHEEAPAWVEKLEALLPIFHEVREEWERLTGLLYENAERSAGSASGEGGYVLRLQKDKLPANWQDIVALEDNIYMRLSEVCRTLDKLLSELKDAASGLDMQSAVTDMSGHVANLARVRDDLRFLIRLADPNVVYWVEANSYYKHRSLAYMSVPIDVSKQLWEQFFSQKESIVLTSATLSVNQTFDYAVEQLGLKDAQERGLVKTVQLPSPFRYEEQALVLVPRDFPTIRGSYADSRFLEMLSSSLTEIALVTRGRMLVLFTSYKMLRQVHGELKNQLSQHHIQVLGQGIESSNRSKLVRMFQETPNCVLLGTSSFWEGVDIPGEALSVLAIVRLPFQPPNHPYIEAKSEYLKSLGMNPFMKYSVPQAVIQFKQGFGRLVRTVNDKGIVVVYDTRVIDTQYGKHFLRSLPKPRMENAVTASMGRRIREWLGSTYS
jgi:ATP-dependent DNA helicase DinG